MKGRNSGRVIQGRGRKYAAVPSSEGPKAVRTAGVYSAGIWSHVWTSSGSRLSAHSPKDQPNPGSDVTADGSFKETPLKPRHQATFSLGLRNTFAGQELSFCCRAETLTPTTRQFLHLGGLTGCQ
jgi:hypothetical protein